MSSTEFVEFIEDNKIIEFYLVGADAIACVKTTNNSLLKAGYKVNVISDCITSYDKKKVEEMLNYYQAKGSKLVNTNNI